MPVILFTAKRVEDFASRAKEAGANEHILKPFEKKELLDKIKKIINK